MYLYEYEAIELFKKYGIPVEKSCLVKDYSDLEKCLYEIPLPNVLKAQVLGGKRGKSGGIIFPKTESEYYEGGRKLLKGNIAGMKVDSVLVSEKIDIEKEMYLAITIDRSTRKFLVIASPKGGMNIEELASCSPNLVEKIIIDPLIGYSEYVLRKVSNRLSIPVNKLKKVFVQLYDLFIDNKCELVEINPLVLSSDGRLIALDRKILVDDSYVRLNNSFKEILRHRLDKMNIYERVAYEYGFSYVKLEGNIAIIGNGAGLTMATMDIVSFYGGTPGVFLDLGGGASSERVKNALFIVINDQDIDKIFINILGGITRCDEVARGIVDAIDETNTNKKLFIRLIGNNEEIGRKILLERGIMVFRDLEEAVKKMVES